MLSEQAKKGRPVEVKTTCPHCHGSGKDFVKVAGKTKPFEKACPVCGGKGFIKKVTTPKEGKQQVKEYLEHRRLAEQAPSNSMGQSSSIDGPIQTYDPLQKKRDSLLRRKTLSIGQIGGSHKKSVSIN